MTLRGVEPAGVKPLSERLPGYRRGPRRHSAGPRFFQKLLPPFLFFLEYPDVNSFRVSPDSGDNQPTRGAIGGGNGMCADISIPTTAAVQWFRLALL
jgi:hypothetical protein